MRPVIRAAAVILLILGLGIPALYFALTGDRTDQGSVSQSSVKGVTTLDLPDGSRVFLNKGAEISYPKDFSQDRSIHLDGEAYFEVMTDPELPFRVYSGKVLVSVLGTSFNVKQREGTELTEVYVESGRVRISDLNCEQTITLVPGDLGISDGSQFQHGNIDNLNYLSWKTKEFIFVDESVRDVLGVLENAYHVEIRFENSEIADSRLTSTYKEQSIDAILETICTAFNLELKKNGNTFYLNSN